MGASVWGACASDVNGSYQWVFTVEVDAVSFLFWFSFWTVTWGRTGDARVMPSKFNFINGGD